MPEVASFADLIRRVRAGDQGAATEMVRQFEPEIRRVVRLRLTDPRLRRVVDSADICQSVLANFFVRVAAGQFEIETPEQLLKLLAKMARNRLLNYVDRHNAQRRDVGRQVTDAAALDAVAAEQPTASRIAVGAELLRLVREAMTEDERRLHDMRNENRSWEEIAAVVGGTPEATRKRYERTMDRVVQALRVDESSLM
jgi:RNA polymerase sigma-70 factor (ECF subfamily)